MILLDVLAVVCDLKTVSYINIRGSAREYLAYCRDVARFFGLRFTYAPPTVLDAPGQAIFSKQQTLIRQTEQLRALDPETPELLALLGYPKCCSDFFENFNAHPGKADLVDLIERNTRPGAARPFVVNNTLNSAGRDLAPDSPTRRIMKIHVLPWHPCRYDCPESIAKGRVLFAFIAALAPELGRLMRTALRGVALHFDQGECVIFDGRRSGRSGLRYAALRYSSLRSDDPLLAALLAGDELSIEHSRVRVRRDGRTLRERACKNPLLLDFTAD